MQKNMSRINRTVDIVPSPIETTKIDEVLVSVGHRCPNCEGLGWLWAQPDESNFEEHKVKCSVCAGTGELDAVIRIHWKAHKEG